MIRSVHKLQQNNNSNKQLYIYIYIYIYDGGVQPPMETILMSILVVPGKYRAL